MLRKFIVTIMFLLVIFSMGNIAFGFDQEDIEIHGFVSQGFLKSSDNDYLGDSSRGSYEFNEIGLNFAVPITDDLRFGIQFFSRDLGNYGNNELTIDWAFLDYTWKDWLGFRAGKIKMPFGFYNRQRDADMLRTAVQLPQSVYNEALRDFVVALHGFSLYGSARLGAFGYIDYELFTGTFDVPPDTPYIAETVSMLQYSNPTVYNSLVANGVDLSANNTHVRGIQGGMLVWNTPLSGLRLGVTDFFGEIDFEFAEVTSLMKLKEFSVLSAEYDIGDLTFSAERFMMDVDSKKSTEGYYGSITWEIVNWVSIGAAYGEYYPNADDKNGSKLEADGVPDYYAWQKDITASIRFNVNEFWCFKFETRFINGLGLTSIAANPPEDSEQNWNLCLLKTSLSF